MHMILKIFLQFLLLCCLPIIATQQSWALRCLEGNVATTKFTLPTTNSIHTTTIGAIQVTNTSQTAGTLLWESPTLTITFTCYDDYMVNSTEHAYLYLDNAAGLLKDTFKTTNLILGVRQNGNEYPIDGSTARIDLGLAALQKQNSSSKASANCKLINKNGYCADPKTITVSYSLYLKSRGSGKNFNTLASSYEVFQLDGAGGRNSNGNFHEKVTGMNVTYIECVPVVTTQNVDLGNYYSYQDVQTILRRTAFSLNIQTNGKDCAQYPFTGRFSSAQKYNQNTITVAESALNGTVGIQIFKANDATPINLENNIDFGNSNGIALTKNFEAGVLFLKKPSASGSFSSTLNYEVYFK